MSLDVFSNPLAGRLGVTEKLGPKEAQLPTELTNAQWYHFGIWEMKWLMMVEEVPDRRKNTHATL